MGRGAGSGRGRRAVWAAAMAVALGATAAAAGERPADRDLAAPAEADRPAASGAVTPRDSGRTRSLRIRVEGLRARHDYVVVADDERAGEFRTNRKGRGKVRLKDRAAREGRPVRETADAASDGMNGDDSWTWADGSWDCVQIYDAETGACVLTCKGDDHDGGGNGDGDDDVVDHEFLHGFGEYASDAGHTAWVSLSSTTWGTETWEDMFVSVSRISGDGTLYEGWDWFAWSAEGLPLDAASVADLAGRAFEIRDLEGAVVLSGDLPELIDLGYDIYDPLPMPVETPPPGGGGMRHETDGVSDGDQRPGTGEPGDPGDGNVTPPWDVPVEPSENDLVLFIAGDSGVFEEAGILHYWFYEWTDEPWICPEPGDGSDGHDGDRPYDDGAGKPDGTNSYR